MAGLLDIFDTYEGQQALGLLAAAGPRTDPNQTGFGQRLSDGLGQAQKWKANQLLQEDQKQQTLLRQMQAQEAQQKIAQETKMRELASKFQGSPGLAPLQGDTASGILPSTGRPATGFDYSGYAQALAGVDPIKALALQQSLKKDQQINKIDAKDFTPASLAKFTASGNYNDLVRLSEAHFANTGGQTVALDKFTGKPLNSIDNTQSPDNRANNAVTMRGQNLTNSLGRDRLNFDIGGGFDGNKPKLVGDNWVTAPKDMGPGQVVPAMASVGQKDAKEALKLIETAKGLIPSSTGSYLGAGVDQVARVFGSSTGGDTAAAQLKALEGALVSKMPKMSGPQSDKDVLLYKQMAGEIGDPTIPGSRKMAALKVIEEIQQRHAGVGAISISTPTNPVGGWSIQRAK